MNLKKIFQKPFFLIFLFITFIDLTSFISFLIFELNKIFFIILSLIIFLISLFKIDYVIFALLAELFIGSKGHLFYLEVGSFRISFRMILFTIVILTWFFGLIKGKYKASFLRSKFFPFYLLFFVFLFLGVLIGFFNRNQKDLIFFDANAWLYFLLIFPFFDVINLKDFETIFKILIASLIYLSIKTFVIFFLFTHQIKTIMPDLYYWIRTRGLGEITALDSFYRIFFQSQIYSLIGFFIILSLIVFSQKLKNFWYLLIPTTSIIISFSRSYWLAFSLTLLIFLLFLKIKEIDWHLFKKITLATIFVILFSFGLIYLSLKLPPKVKIEIGSLIEKRFEIEEPAFSSRIAQLPYLLKAILEKPIFGSGFGKTVSYFSHDPRALERHPLGFYTTYAFEWGYLDIWLKIGLIGLFSFLILIFKIFKEGSKLISDSQLISNEKKGLILGLNFGLIALIFTHLSSPYLNHPLGIGYLMLLMVIYEKSKT